MRYLFSTLCVALIALAGVQPAHATITFTLGNNPQSGEENVLFGAPETGNPINGTTNQSGVLVQFTSTTDTLVQKAQGQADIFAQDGLLQNITVTTPGGSYTDLIINPMNGSGTATVTVTDNFNQQFTYDLGNGQNFLTIVASSGETIVSTTIDDPSPNGWLDFKQPRISGATGLPGPVPEPTTIAMALTGLIPIGLIQLRRLRRRHAATLA